MNDAVEDLVMREAAGIVRAVARRVAVAAAGDAEVAAYCVARLTGWAPRYALRRHVTDAEVDRWARQVRERDAALARALEPNTAVSGGRSTSAGLAG